MCLKRLNYDRKELERRREDSALQNKGQVSPHPAPQKSMCDSCRGFSPLQQTSAGYGEVELLVADSR